MLSSLLSLGEVSEIHNLPLATLSQPWYLSKVASIFVTTDPPFVTMFVTSMQGLHLICDNAPTGSIVTNAFGMVMIHPQ